MSKELVIGSNRHETKVAVLEDDQVVEVYFQRANEYSLAGSIHKGKVTRVLPGMQSAFVDLGLERDTFLYVSDFFEEHDDIDTVSDERAGRRERNGVRGGDRRAGNRPTQAIEEQPAGLKEAAVAVGEAESAPVGEAEVTDAVSDAQDTNTEGTERNFRNERRGRRSRRRRPRGRGFPENKYAQPSANVPSQAAESETSATEIESEDDDSGLEVILLPGESLAKYRQTAVSAESEDEEPITEREDLAKATKIDEPSAGTPEMAANEEGDLAEEAEEIALADRVFSHRDDEDAELDSEELESQARPQEAPESHRESAVVTELKPSIAPEDHEPTDASVLKQQPIALDEYEVLAIQEGLTGIDEPVLDVPGEISAAEAKADALESEADVDADAELSKENAEASPNEPNVQSATVREPNGRYMHRVSRRMRRRRGGNRGPQSAQLQDVSGDEGRPEIALATGTGTAPAPEARSGESHREKRNVEKPERTYPSISDLLKPGQEIIVQIAKEPLGQKGARITSHIALPGRYVVFMPSVTHLGVSRKVASDEERQRLKKILQARRPGSTGGFIVRTAGEGIPEEEIAADMKFLYDLWQDIKQKAEKKPAPALLHYDLDIVQRILRDQVTSDFKAIWVDNEDLYESVVTFIQRFQPALVSRVKMYTRQAPIFDAFNITQELEKALRPKVWLKSGGYIVINQTEALVAIDINTGKYVGKSNRLEDTIVKTNTEAVKEIVRQIRLRDLGGIIVVDFIDMDERKNRQKVMQALEEAMRADKAPYKILQFNDFGLVAITRKRVKQSLERTLCAPCPYCEAAGYVKSVTTVISEILIEAQKISRAIEGTDVVLRVHPDVAKVLKASDNQYLEELEEILKRPVLVTGDATLHHQKFDLA